MADSGYHSEANVKMAMEGGIDAFIADPRFRKRDPRLAQVDRYSFLLAEMLEGEAQRGARYLDQSPERPVHLQNHEDRPRNR